MRGALAVASREVQEKKVVLAAAAIAGLLPVTLRALLGRGWADELYVLALALMAAFPLAAGLALGAGAVGRDVGERRLSFYFARPLSGAAIWLGKIAAALGLTFLTVVLVATPALLWMGETFLDGRLGTQAPAVFFGWIPLVVVTVSHAAACLYRSRSSGLAFDLIAGAVLAVVYAALAFRLADAGAVGTLAWVAAPVTAVLLLVALVAAGAAVVIVGRADVRRGHRALSFTLWGTLGLGAAGFAAFSQWVLAVTPWSSGLPAASFVDVAPKGERASVLRLRGQRAFFAPAFLIDSARGRYVRIGGGETMMRPVFDPSGRHAAWLEHSPVRRKPRLALVHLDDPELAISRVAFVDFAAWPLALSEDGKRLLMSGGGRVRVHDTGDGRVIAEAPLGRVVFGSFIGPDRVRVGQRSKDTASPSAAFTVTDWEPSTGRVSERARFAQGAARIYDIRSGRFLFTERSRPGVRPQLYVYDIETARQEAVDIRGAGDVRAAQWLAGGRLLLSTRHDDGERVRVLDGARVVVDVAPDVPTYGGAEVGQVIVLRTLEWRPERRGALFVDLTTGALRRESDLVALHTSGWSYGRDPLARPEPGSLAGRLFKNREGRLLVMDAATGKMRDVFASSH